MKEVFVFITGDRGEHTICTDLGKLMPGSSCKRRLPPKDHSSRDGGEHPRRTRPLDTGCSRETHVIKEAFSSETASQAGFLPNFSLTSIVPH